MMRTDYAKAQALGVYIRIREESHALHIFDGDQIQAEKWINRFLEMFKDMVEHKQESQWYVSSSWYKAGQCVNEKWSVLNYIEHYFIVRSAYEIHRRAFPNMLKEAFARYNMNPLTHDMERTLMSEMVTALENSLFKTCTRGRFIPPLLYSGNDSMFWKQF